MRLRPAHALSIVIVAVLLNACATTTESLIEQHRLERSVWQGADFAHLLLAPNEPASGRRLHIYLHGDGRPWWFGRTPASDPSPAAPVTLGLMTRDTVDRVYVGRPCYYGLRDSESCVPAAWTSGRYSASVIASMSAAIRAAIENSAHDEAILFGFSGGGVIARLAAPQIPQTVAVVTIAANLDTDAWTDFHGYLPLSESLNPRHSPALPPSVPHIQLVGSRDTVVPAAITAAYLESGQRLEVWEYEDFDHACCWESAWPDILRRVERQLETSEALNR